MRLKILIICFWLILVPNFVFSQEIGFSNEDAQVLYRLVEENPLLKQQVVVLKGEVSNLEKEKELMEKELDIKDQLIEVEQKRTEVYKEAFEKEKELTDRALKLAKQTEKKAFWEKLGFIGIAIAAIVLAFM